MDKNVRHFAAAGYIFCGMAVIGLSDNAMPLLTPVTSLWVFHLMRSAMVIAMLLGIALIAGLPLLPKNWLRVTGRNLFSGGAMFLYFGALAFVPIGVAVAGLFTAPVWVLLFSVVFRAERVGWVRWLAVVMGFGGAVLVINPAAGGLSLAAVVPVMAGVLYAIGALATRSWCEGEGTAPMLFSYYLVIGIGALIGLGVLALNPMQAAPGAAGFVARGWVTPDLPTWGWIGFQAVTSIIGVGCLTKGYQLGEATYVAINEYALLVFASVFAWVLWGQTLSWTELAGMAMIVGSGAAIALRTPR
ncbi:DMT family transporter [Marivivens marinus]|uniref:DMT family transporter n=1 Tax=Marivivens marinus TaxID=3110173 RepID=UPI003B84558B